MAHWKSQFNPRLLSKASTVKDAEVHEQIKVINWARAQENRWPALRWLMAIPNGGYRLSPGQAGRMRAMGTKAGASDLFLPTARLVGGDVEGDFGHLYHGLWIEMKAIQVRANPEKPGEVQIKMGEVKKDQVEFLEAMRSQGYARTICWCAEDAQRSLREYLLGEWVQPEMDWLLAGALQA